MVEPWTAPLEAGDPDAAWDLFIERYRRLIFGAIRGFAADPDDVMDVFAVVCAAFRENDFARLRACAARVDPHRPISTWLVVVVRNLTIDWLRRHHGRPGEPAIVASLSPLQKQIFRHVFIERRSHVEAYELIRTRDAATPDFKGFLKEVTATYRALAERPGGPAMLEIAPPVPDQSLEHTEPDPAVLSERQTMLGAALESLSDADRAMLQLYIIEGIPAARVAHMLGYPSAKAIYNRVYRALLAIRQRLEAAGIRAGDL